MAQDIVYVRRALRAPSVRSVYPAICGKMAANVSRTTTLPMSKLPDCSASALSPSAFFLDVCSLCVIPKLWLEECAVYALHHCWDKSPAYFSTPLPEPPFHPSYGCNTNAGSEGARCGLKQTKKQRHGRMHAAQSQRRVAHSRHNSWVNIDCLTHCLWSSLPAHKQGQWCPTLMLSFFFFFKGKNRSF